MLKGVCPQMIEHPWQIRCKLKSRYTESAHVCVSELVVMKKVEDTKIVFGVHE